MAPRSATEKARQRGNYNQDEIDRQIAIAAGLRVLTEWGIKALPKGDAPEQTAARESLMERLEKEVIDRIEDAVPYHLKDKATTYRGTQVSREMREQLIQEAEEAAGIDPEARAAASWKGKKSSWSRTWSSSSSSSWWQEPHRSSSGWQSWWQQGWKR